MVTDETNELYQFNGVFEKVRSADIRLIDTSNLELEHVLGPTIVLFLANYKAKNGKPSFADFISRLEHDDTFFSEFMHLARHRLENVAKLELKKKEYKKWVTGCLHSDVHQINKVFNYSFNKNNKILTKVCGDLHETPPSFLVESKDFKLYLKRGSNGNLQVLEVLWSLISEDEKILDLVWPKSLNLGDHSWYESIDRKPLSSKEQASRYYRRFGQIMCLAYALRMSDLHYENIIAHGEYPVIIDYETLGALNINESYRKNDVSFNYKLLKRINNSVLMTGMLPLAANQSERDDVGAISSKRILRSVKELVDIGTLDMRFERRDRIVSTNTASPFLNKYDGEENLAWEDYYDDILDGFHYTYTAILKVRKELIAKLESVAASIESRILLRNTREYAAVIEALKSYRFQERKEYIWKIFCEKKYGILSSNLVDYERSVLEVGLIPSFYCRANSKDLYGGNKQLLCELSLTPMTLMKQQLERLNTKDLKFQVDVIEFSLKGVATVQNTQWITYCETCKKNSLIALKSQTQIASDLSFSIEEFFTKYAVIDKHNSKNRYWFGANVDDRDNLVIDVVSSNLYSGRDGIETVLKNSLPDDKNGQFTSSSVYLSYMSRLIVGEDRNRFLSCNINEILNCVRKDSVHDVLGGNAGFIFSLADMNTDYTHVLIQEAAYSLKKKMICEEGILRWPIGNEVRKANASFAHGNAGIGLSLLKAGIVLHNEEYVDLGLKAIKTDDSFINASGLWVDTRHIPSIPTANWCNGTTGMVLSRYLLLELDKTVGFLDYFERQKAREEIHLGIQHILSSFYSLTSFSMCHGISGNLKLLIFLDKQGLLSVNQSVELSRQIKLFLRYIVDFGCGFGNNRFQSLGLMTGLAGIKLFLDELSNDKATLFPLIPVRSDANEND